MAPATLTRPSLAEQFATAFPRSRQLHEQARGLFPDGVTHDLRYLEPFPVYVDRAEGGRKWTVEGRELVDFWSGHGAILLGHSHPAVVEAVRRQMGLATHPGACHEGEIAWGSSARVRSTASGSLGGMMTAWLATSRGTPGTGPPS